MPCNLTEFREINLSASIVLDRFDYWQALYIIAKGHYQEVRAAGLDALRRSIVEIEPGFAKHVEHLTDWQQFSLLSVEASRCPGWYKPGLVARQN